MIASVTSELCATMLAPVMTRARATTPTPQPGSTRNVLFGRIISDLTGS